MSRGLTRVRPLTCRFWTSSNEAGAGLGERLVDAAGAWSGPRLGLRGLEAARPYGRGDLLVRVAEGNALADEQLGGVGRPQERVGGGLGEPVAVEPSPPTSTASAFSAPRTSLRAAKTGGLSSCRSRS